MTMVDVPNKRMARERRTIRVMLGLYCQDHHGGKSPLCPNCAELLSYAEKRLSRCPYQEGKTTCAKCPIHCYSQDMREKIAQVMRYAGPRMLFLHPILAFWHLVDGMRKEPIKRKS